jgi:hyperosmotically inducible periplasmic protein
VQKNYSTKNPNQMKKILAIIAIVAFAFALPACKGKVSDADLKASVEKALQANPDLSGVTAQVAEGVVTLAGNVKDDAAKAAIDAALKDVKGIKSVTNNATVPPPPTIASNEVLTAAVKAAIKDNPTVAAAVADSIVTLTGEIKKADLAKLMQKVQATHPKKVVSDKLVKK